MSHGWKLLVPIAALVVALSAVACGDEDGDGGGSQAGSTGTDAQSGPDPGEVVTTFYRGVGKDPTASCRTLSEAALQGSGGQKGCERTFRKSNKEVRDVQIRATEVTGNTAKVRFNVDPGKGGSVTLTQEGGEWKIDQFEVDSGK